jgi:CBS domain-containing protein
MNRLARDLMQGNLVTVRENTSLLDAVHLLVKAHISGMPVLDPAGAVVGVISATDALLAIDQALDDDRDEGESQEPLDFVTTLEVGELATPEVVFVSPDASAADVAQLMRSEGIHRVLVGSRERLEGIITAFDLLGAI